MKIRSLGLLALLLFLGVMLIIPAALAQLTLEISEEWYTVGNTVVRSVSVGDVDGDGDTEIVTGGYAHDGTRTNGQLRVWNWDGTTMTLEKSEEWYTVGNTYVESVSVGDVDGDGDTEIVTGGYAFVTPYNGQLRVWNWDGTTMTLEKSQEWYTVGNTYVESVSVGDVDGDADTEIVTGGHAKDGTFFNGQLRVWSIYVAPEGIPEFSLSLPIITSTGAALYLLLKKRQRKN